MNSNQKMIKLHGGPQDGAIVKVLHSLHEYTVEMVLPNTSLLEPVKFVYRETPHRAANGEVVFSIYDSMP